MLSESLQENRALLCLDISYNENVDEEEEYHDEIAEGLLNNGKSRMQKVVVTTKNRGICTHYNEVGEVLPEFIFVNLLTTHMDQDDE